ncbi:L-rhamnose mutarotase [Halorubrum lipolyticum]|uniref:L-rhamnose mutarotase n=1 Tax=Halorubrum lipolyticum DSM 21995 TaxID=1227482 RepID=M0NSU1_9EURY|nr:L-rhamnose mutarotase [Halorubrum lipolyticum]EMA59690.1 hypothetical protein C469_10221 [Halorubrum lipolyticum DSM 21995]
MARIAFHLEIRDGKREEYRAKHENVPEALESAYVDSDAGLQTYSVFEKDGHVFGFMEVDDPEAIREVMDGSEAQAEWAEVMSGVTVETDDSWMDEVYRMV